jgi:hypothetical protein
MAQHLLLAQRLKSYVADTGYGYGYGYGYIHMSYSLEMLLY